MASSSNCADLEGGLNNPHLPQTFGQNEIEFEPNKEIQDEIEDEVKDEIKDEVKDEIEDEVKDELEDVTTEDLENKLTEELDYSESKDETDTDIDGNDSVITPDNKLKIRPLSIHFLDIHKLNAIAGVNVTDDNCETVIDKLVEVYNQSKVIKYTAVNHSFQHDLFHLKIYKQVRNYETNLSNWLRDVGCKEDLSETTIYYILFFYREFRSKEGEEGLTQKEIFALTTGQGFHVVLKFSDFEFSYKIVRRLFKSEHIKDTSKLLLGVAQSYTTFMRKPTDVSCIDAMNKLYKNIKLKLKDDSSIFKYKCYQTKSSEPRKSGLTAEMGTGTIRLCKEITIEDYAEILDHLAAINSGTDTFRFSNLEERETDSTDFKYLNYLQLANNRAQDLEKELNRMVYEAVKQTKPYKIRKFCSDVEKLKTEFMLSGAIDCVFSIKDIVIKSFCAGVADVQLPGQTIEYIKTMAATLCFNIQNANQEQLELSPERDAEFIFSSLLNSSIGVSEPKFLLSFCHYNILDYVNAEIHKFQYKDINTDCEDAFSVDKMLEQVATHIDIDCMENETTFAKKLEKVNISFRCKGALKKAKFIKYLEGEIFIYDEDSELKISYWRLCNAWYRVHVNFLELIRDEFVNMLDATLLKFPLLSEIWPKGMKEGQYNKKYIGKPRFFFGDIVCPEKIELFDLCFHSQDDTVYLIQVKEGLANNTRAACSQILNSAKLISAVKDKTSTEKSIVNKFCDMVFTTNDDGESKHMKNVKTHLENFGLDNFRGLFKKNLTFVYACADDAISNRYLSEEKKINTPITKDLLKELLKNIDCNLEQKADDVFNDLKTNHYLRDGDAPILSQTFYEVTKQDNFQCSSLDKTSSVELYKVLKKNYKSEFHSTILRLDLLRLKNELQNLNFEFKIYQIPRTNDADSNTPKEKKVALTSKKKNKALTPKKKTQNNNNPNKGRGGKRAYKGGNTIPSKRRR